MVPLLKYSIGSKVAKRRSCSVNDGIYRYVRGASNLLPYESLSRNVSYAICMTCVNRIQPGWIVKSCIAWRTSLYSTYCIIPAYSILANPNFLENTSRRPFFPPHLKLISAELHIHSILSSSLLSICKAIVKKWVFLYHCQRYARLRTKGVYTIQVRKSMKLVFLFKQ